MTDQLLQDLRTQYESAERICEEIRQKLIEATTVAWIGIYNYATQITEIVPISNYVDVKAKTIDLSILRMLRNNRVAQGNINHASIIMRTMTFLPDTEINFPRVASFCLFFDKVKADAWVEKMIKAGSSY